VLVNYLTIKFQMSQIHTVKYIKPVYIHGCMPIDYPTLRKDIFLFGVKFLPLFSQRYTVSVVTR